METSWKSSENAGRLSLVHDNRWLAIIGVPIMMVGLTIAIGLWFIDSVRDSDNWPILATGSLIGVGFFVMGLALCFKYEEVIGNRDDGTLTQNKGLPPFRRSKTWTLTDIQEVVCLDAQLGRGSSGSLHRHLYLMGPDVSVLLASDLEAAPIRYEAERWANFLNLPIRDKMDETLENKFRERSNSLNK